MNINITVSRNLCLSYLPVKELDFQQEAFAHVLILTMDFSFAPSNSFRDLYHTKHPHKDLLDDAAVSEVQLDVERHEENSRGTPPLGSAWNAFLSHIQEHVVWTGDQAFVSTADEVGWKIGYRRSTCGRLVSMQLLTLVILYCSYWRIVQAKCLPCT
jgi:hypothetical protein